MFERLQLALHLEANNGDVATLCRELPPGDAPEWIELLPPGVDIVGRDGRKFRNPDPRGVVAAFNGMIPIDYEHATELKAPKGEEAPAAGWIVALEAREGGSIWGKVDWTPRGAAAVKNREYRFDSPAFLHQDGVVKKIVSVGLTNRPNLHLTALNHRAGNGDTMDPELLKALGLPEGATKDQALAALNSLKADKDALGSKLQAALNSQPSLDKFVPRADYDAALNRAQSAEAEIKATKDAARAAQVDAVIDAALKAGKITPATVEYHREQCKRDGGIELFQKFVEAAPVVAQDQVVRGKHEKQDSALNSEAMAIIEACGITPEQYALGAN